MTTGWTPGHPTKHHENQRIMNISLQSPGGSLAVWGSKRTIWEKFKCEEEAEGWDGLENKREF